MVVSKRMPYAALLLLALTGSTEARDWSHQGNVLSGAFERIRGDEVVLRQGDSSVVVNLAELSDADQKFIASLTKERVWTNGSGKQIVASFVGRDAEQLTIQKAGREFTIPIASLSKSDQAYLERKLPWNAEAPSAADPFANPAEPSPASRPGREAAARSAIDEATAGVRVWTRIDGRKVRGRFLRMTGQLVRLETDSGETAVPLAILSKQDQALVRELMVDSSPEYATPDTSLGTVEEPAPTWSSTPETPPAETPPAVSAGDTWVLRDGESVTGSFQKRQGNLVWLSRNPGVTVLPLDRFTPSDQQRILGMSVPPAAPAVTQQPLAEQWAAADHDPPAMEPSDLPASARPSSNAVATAPSSAANQGAACSNCGRPGYIKPGGHCAKCGAQKPWSHQLRIGEAPTQFGSVPGPGGSPSSSRIRIGGRGLAKLAIGLCILVFSGFVGLLKLLFGSSSTKRR